MRTCSSAACPTCRCGHSRPPSARVPGCSCSCSGARPSSCRHCSLEPGRTSSSCWSRARATSGAEGGDLLAVAADLWSWLSAEERRGLLTLWVEGYARSLIDPDGPWGGFAAATVADWLEVLTAAAEAPGAGADAGAGGRAAGEVEPTLVLAVLRGALLDLLATGEVERTTGAVNRQLALLRGDPA